MRPYSFFHDVLFIFSLCLLISCNTAHKGAEGELFTLLKAEKTGISFINHNPEDDQHNILQYEYFYNGGGVALGDVNNDGLTDVYFTSNQGENALYLNKGDMHFEDITQHAGVGVASGWKTGVAMIDINADGYLDIYVSRSGAGDPSSRQNILFINNQDLTFTDQAKSYGLNDDSYSTQASFLDYDRDGDLDVFLLNHSRLTISNSFDINRRNTNQREPYVGNKLFRNDNGKFRDVSDSSGVFGPASNYGLGIAYGDLNQDGWPDLYASNDYTGKDKLLYNDLGKGFREVGDSVLTHMSQFSMGVDIADVNNDGLEDIFSLDMLPESNQRQKELLWPNKYDVYQAMVKNGLHHQYMRNMLHLNNGDGTFSEIGQLAGVSHTDWSWAALLADFDNDGLQDVFVSNGFKREFINNDFLKYKADLRMKARQGKQVDRIADIISKMPSNKVHNYMFRNENGVSFTDVSVGWGFGGKNLTNGVAYGDLDNDGDLDLVMNNLDDVATVLRNNARELTKKSYLKVRVKGSDRNTHGLGAVVTLYSQAGMMTRTLCPFRGFQSSMEPILFFGLDTLKSIDSLHIVWPRGDVQTLKNVGVNKSITLIQRDAIKPATTGDSRPVLFSPIANTIPFKHHEDAFVDFRVQPLLPRTYSASGPALASGDVNGDGLDDIFLGGAHRQESVIMLQRPDGTYAIKTQPDLKSEAAAEDIDAVFFDMDGDKDADLYVVSGGNEFPLSSPLYHDRLYQNDGNGNFRKFSLPPLNSSGSCVHPADVDQDGDIDLFVGSRLVPGRYPEPAESYLLLNDGKGNFSNDTFTISGMVTDASWVDLNKDSWPDLIVAGEWMPLSVYINEQGHLIDKTSTFIKEKTNGWWNRILAHDFDGDGDVDFAAGNFGMNNQFSATPERPATLYYADYDGNGSIDPILNYFIEDRSYPSPTRDELVEQLPSFRKRFTDYASYATVTIEGILNKDELKRSSILTAYSMETSYFQNNGDSFIKKALPWQVQVAPVLAMLAVDVNKDGHIDIITGGNLTKMGPRFGRASGNFGTILLGDGKGNFNAATPKDTGLCIRGDVRNIVQHGNTLIFGINDGVPEMWKMKIHQ